MRQRTLSGLRCAGGVLVAVLCGHGVTSADERLALTEVLERALSFYPSVAASIAGRDAAASAVGEAEAERLPFVSIRGTATRYQDPMVVHPIHAFTPNQTPPFDRTLFQVLGQVSYTVYDGGARSSRIQSAQAEQAAAEEILAGTGQNLLSLVIGTYLEALGQKREIEAHDRSIAALESERSRVSQLFDVGRAARIEILRVEAAIASAEAERVGVASSLDRAERSLARFMGASVEETRAHRLVAVSLVRSALPPRDALRERALSSSPSVRAARQQLRSAESRTLVARGARLPDVNLDASYINYASASGVNQLEWNLGVRVSYPLFTGGAVESAIARAQASERRAEEEVRLAESEVDEALDRSLAAIDEAEARLASLTTAVRRFEEVVRIERLRLDTGTGTQSDYLAAEAELLAARADWIRAQYGLVFARTDLARVTGTLDRDWVASNLRNAP